jgi:hypothetical protein
MEKREMRPRKFNGRDARRDEIATWRQSHGSDSLHEHLEATLPPGQGRQVSFVRREQNGEARLSTKHDPSIVTGDV